MNPPSQGRLLCWSEVNLSVSHSRVEPGVKSPGSHKQRGLSFEGSFSPLYAPEGPAAVPAHVSIVTTDSMATQKQQGWKFKLSFRCT